MLKVNDINVYYGSIHAIKDVSFEVNDGEIVTLIGANGAGKSTILQTVSGLLRSKTGSVEFENNDLSAVPAHKIVAQGLAHVPEGRRIFLQMTVEDNLIMGAYTRPNSEIDESIANVEEALAAHTRRVSQPQDVKSVAPAAKRVVEQQYEQRSYDPDEYNDITPEQLEEMTKL